MSNKVAVTTDTVETAKLSLHQDYEFRNTACDNSYKDVVFIPHE
jgi:hypothetical protein